jgi:hypothetical protein
VVPVAGVLNAYVVPITSAQNADERFFTTTVAGVTTFNGPVARYVRLCYRLTTDTQGTAGALAARNLIFYPAINSAVPGTTPGARNFSIARLPGGAANIPAQTGLAAVDDEILMNPGDNVRLAVIFDGTFTGGTPVPTFAGICFTAEAMLTPL